MKALEVRPCKRWKEGIVSFVSGKNDVVEDEKPPCHAYVSHFYIFKHLFF